MEKTVIKPGKILVKRDGKIYELNHRIFNEIRAIIFDTDTELCRHCKHSRCKDIKQIDDSFITDALTIKDKSSCDYVLGCKRVELKEEESGIRRLAWFSTDHEELNADEETKKHYADAHVRHLAHPTVARHINRIK